MKGVNGEAVEAEMGDAMLCMKGLAAEQGPVLSAEVRGFNGPLLPYRPATPGDVTPVKGIDGEAVEAEMGDVMARMKELATHRGDAARRSKRDRSALKSTFRDLITHVEVSIRDATLEPSKLARRDELRGATSGTASR